MRDSTRAAWPVRWRHALPACVALGVSLLPGRMAAQFTDPRTYSNSPVGMSQLELSYGYGRANASIDSAIIIANARLDLNQGTISYTRYFGFLRRMAWVSPGIPIAGLSGSVSGTSVRGSVAGAGDSSYQAAMLLKGGPAMGVAEFKDYQPTTSIGVSITVTAPTGVYRPDKILNLGSDRWSFKPEIGLSCPFGPQQKWVADVYANTSFFTDDNSYRGKEVLRQSALPGFEGHISYSFLGNLVGSLDTRYSFNGDQIIDGKDQDNTQKNFLLGSEAILSLNERNTLTVIAGKALVHQNGPAQAGISLRYDYVWGRGYR